MEIHAPNINNTYQQLGDNSFIYEETYGLTLGVKNGEEFSLVNRPGEYIIHAVPDAGVHLYYNGAEKIYTTSGGVKVNGIMDGLASEAYYADLAEKYTIKDECEVGDVILISEDENFDGELSESIGSNKILGVVSDEPAYGMNSKLENGKYIALKGRIKCKVQGPIKKGDPLVTYVGGCATGRSVLRDEQKADPFGRLLGRANESINDYVKKIIEIIV